MELYIFNILIAEVYNMLSILVGLKNTFCLGFHQIVFIGHYLGIFASANPSKLVIFWL